MYLMPPEMSDRLYHQAFAGYEDECNEAVAAWATGDNTQTLTVWSRFDERAKNRSVDEVLYDAMDDDHLIEQFKNVLRFSKCDLVLALRASLIKQVVKQNGESIAEMRAGSYDAED